MLKSFYTSQICVPRFVPLFFWLLIVSLCISLSMLLNKINNLKVVDDNLWGVQPYCEAWGVKSNSQTKVRLVPNCFLSAKLYDLTVHVIHLLLFIFDKIYPQCCIKGWLSFKVWFVRCIEVSNLQGLVWNIHLWHWINRRPNDLHQRQFGILWLSKKWRTLFQVWTENENWISI